MKEGVLTELSEKHWKERKKGSEYLIHGKGEEKDKLFYEHHEGIEYQEYHFYIRFAGEHFIPCAECQDRLHKAITESGRLFLGNKSYEPAIELNRQWVIDDEAWKLVERRLATPEEKKTLKTLD